MGEDIDTQTCTYNIENLCKCSGRGRSLPLTYIEHVVLSWREAGAHRRSCYGTLHFLHKTHGQVQLSIPHVRTYVLYVHM